jgi:hypothetical protein
MQASWHTLMMTDMCNHIITLLFYI